jgi:hypothetical protein
MAGLVPAIHTSSPSGRKKDVDARDERGLDGGMAIQPHRKML